MELLALSVGIGLAVSLLCSELFGVASGGLIVPGYMALYIMRPLHILTTLAVALATYGIVRLLSTFLVVYGRRRTALMILVGYIIGMLVNYWSSAWGHELSAIGYVIPGLVAVWMDRQTVPQTLASLAIVVVLVRLILVLTVGTELAR
ncbi:MAG: poly-gamma-glutamate biosynthesis protein PgsC [Proteobacteria bacterium]|nr:poly-gamma-glutamate biosynthesis protein PgsC [Pseudomonadota bacterium]